MSITVEPIKLNYIYFKGPTGATGPPGSTSLTVGPTGFTGSVGNQGNQGPLGTQGASGLGQAGLQGPSGGQGSIGPIGDIGVSGAVGSQGPAGTSGDQGPTGVDSMDAGGPTGPQGPQGTTGASLPGPVGPQGQTGPEGAFNSTEVASGMIYRSESTTDPFETDLDPTFTLIRSRSNGSHPCGAVNVTAWSSLTNQVNITSFASDLPGEPAGFTIQTTGVYWFSYNLTILNSGAVTDRVVIFECQVGPGLPFPVAGSRSRTTINDNLTHVSHNFLLLVVAGSQVGLYAANQSADNICLDLDNSSFVAKLLEPTGPGA